MVLYYDMLAAPRVKFILIFNIYVQNSQNTVRKTLAYCTIPIVTTATNKTIVLLLSFTTQQ